MASSDLMQGVVEIWHVDLDDDWSAWVHALSPDEVARVRRQARPEAARWLGAGRAALRRLLGRRLEIDPGDIVLGRSRHGKPRIESPAGLALCFNLSHSGRHALVAIALQPVGVDVEVVQVLEDIAGLAAVACSPAEREWLHRLHPDERNLQFQRLWARKEAYLKATGLGLNEAPDGVCFAGSRVLDAQGRPIEGWQVADLDPAPAGCVASVCIATDEPIVIERLDLRPD